MGKLEGAGLRGAAKERQTEIVLDANVMQKREGNT